MKELMNHNIYEFEDNLVVCGSCLPNMDKEAFRRLEEMSKDIYYVCLETVHMNMVAHKIASILRLGKIKKLIFVSVDKSPHCIQLHYISEELKKMMNLNNIKLENYVSNKGELIKISPEIISLSKELLELSRKS